jgi:hypothetical protein
LTIKPETKFGNEIRKNISAFWQPFTITATAGIPDLYGIRDGVSIWLELKCIKQNSINISPLQISWNYNHFQENGKNYFLVKHTEQRIIKLYDGDKGKELKESGFRVPCIVELRPPYDWQGLGNQLFDGDSILHNG